MNPYGSQPILVFNQNTERENGRKAQIGNITAAKAVADIIRTTLGPRSMLKMILDPMGNIVMTNDGASILREIDVNHPAAKSMIELSRTLDQEVGDGTTSVIILAGEMLHVALPFIEKMNLHPTVIVSAYHKALEDCLKQLEKISQKINPDNIEDLRKIINSSLRTKFVSNFGNLACDLAIDAVKIATIRDNEGKVDDRSIDLKRYVKVEKIPGGEFSQSKVIKGVIINKDIVHSAMRRSIESPRIMLLDCSLEYKKGESQTNIEMTKPEDWQRYLDLEEEYIEKMCKDICKLKPDVVFTEKGVSDLAQHYLHQANISVIRRIRKTDNDRLARATGATIGHQPNQMHESDIGTKCGRFEIRKIGDEYWTYVEECKDPKACSIMLRGGSKDVLMEIERNLQDALNVARNIFLNPYVVPGGGATELSLAAYLRSNSNMVKDVSIRPYQAVADALEIIPRTLIKNCGGHVMDLITKLRAKHADVKNVTFGVDAEKGNLVDMNDLNIWEPLSVKKQIIKTAIESSTILLRIDDVLSGVSKGKSAGGQSMQPQQPAIDSFGDERDG